MENVLTFLSASRLRVLDDGARGARPWELSLCKRMGSNSPMNEWPPFIVRRRIAARVEGGMDESTLAGSGVAAAGSLFPTCARWFGVRVPCFAARTTPSTKGVPLPRLGARVRRALVAMSSSGYLLL